MNDRPMTQSRAFLRVHRRGAGFGAAGDADMASRFWVALVIWMAGALGCANAAVAGQALRAPVRFEPNQGQVDARVRFVAHGIGYGLFVTDEETVLRLEAGPSMSSVVRMRLVGAALARPQGRQPQTGRSHYLALDGSSAVTNIVHYSELVFPAAYPGVDLLYYGTDGQLEYDFIVAAGADPSPIALAISGAHGLSIAANGDLHLDLGGRTLVQRAPVAYQLAGANERLPVAARYRIDAAGQIGFELGAYDRSRALVIDPVLVYSSYLGGNGDEQAFDIAERNGESYVTGRTFSTQFPTTAGSLQPNDLDGVGADCFITKFAGDGGSLVYSTYLGGAGDQYCNAIAVGNDGSAYVVGVLPANLGDAFIAKLNPAGSALAWPAAIRAGSARDEAVAVAVNGAGVAHVAGFTDSVDFPTAGAVSQPGDGPGRGAFVFQVNAAGAVSWATYYDLGGDQLAYAVALDNANAVYIAGSTTESDALGDGFVAKYNATGGGAWFGARVAGNGADAVFDLEVDGASGETLVTGFTESSNLPVTSGALQSVYSGDRDAFLARINASGTSFVWLTYLGGPRAQVGSALGRDAVGNLYVTGRSDTADPNGDAFLLKTGPDATHVHYNLQLGGSATETANGIAVAANGDVWLTGTTSSSDFPVTPGAFDTSDNPGQDAFVMRIGPTLAVQNLVTDVTVAGTTVGPAGANTSPQVVLQPGDLVTLEARGGSVVFHTGNPPCTANFYTVGPAGHPAANGPITVFSSCYSLDFHSLPDPIADANGYGHAGLFRPAQAGIGSARFIGNGSETFTYSGASNATLKLGVNDQPGTPNSGQFNVRVSIVRAGSVAVSIPGGNVGTSAGFTTPQLSLQPGDQVTVQPSGGVVRFNDGPCVQSVYEAGPSGTAIGTTNPCYTDDNVCGSPGSNPIPGQNHAGLIRGQMNGIGGAAWIGNGSHSFIHGGSSPLNLRLGVNDLSCAASPNSGSFNANVTVTRSVSFLSVDNAARSEGNSGSANLRFTVSLTPASAQTVTVLVRTSDRTALAGSDYNALTQTLTFAPGESSKSVDVAVLGDTTVEADERFALELVNPVNGSTALPRGLGTIQSDDLPVLSVNDVSLAEGDAGTAIATFNIALTPAAPFAVSVRVDTADGSAMAPGDYSFAGSTVNFAPGETVVPFQVQVNADNLVEANESFSVNLSNPQGASIGDVQGIGTILNDDAAGTLGFALSGFTVGENGGTVAVDVTRQSGNDGSVSVQFAITNGTAVTPGDWTASPTSGALTFNQGEVVKSFSFQVVDDNVDEENETIVFTLGMPTGGATLRNTQSITTVLDNDAAPSLSIDNGGCSVAEGNGGQSFCTFVLRLSAPSSRVIAFTKTTQSGTATLGTDFGNNTEPGQIAAGQSTLAIAMPVFVDSIYEFDESFSLQIGAVQNATPASLSAVGSIVNDDAAPAFTLTPCVVTEGDSDSIPCSFAVSLANSAQRPVLLAYYSEAPGNRLAPIGDASVESPVVTSQSNFYDTGTSLGAWLVESGNIELKSWLQWQAAHFRQSIDMHGNEPGSIGRDIATVAGQRYLLSFAQSGHPTCGELNSAMTVDFGAQALGSFPFNATGNSTASMGWRYQSRSVVASAATTRLRFRSTTPGSCGPALDDIGLSPAGVASSGIDYVATGVYAEAPLSIPAGTTAHTIVVPVLADNEVEGTEDFLLRVCAIDGGCQNAIGGIDDDDAALPDPVYKNGFE